ncbi:hypothetical protein CALVIDRAFT_16218 [Calocera viscosa TUFC12733]|uniref:Uncharacterized protein n=1 Tax=Calocera viscosa (strain TUFC12733) TaxID=1330018 RepID=A0A167S9I0_CALVF|nr:hypothetical protein CALVIDRAFT_16218 [Calocera viscosa TUFC12733]
MKSPRTRINRTHARTRTYVAHHPRTEIAQHASADPRINNARNISPTLDRTHLHPSLVFSSNFFYSLGENFSIHFLLVPVLYTAFHLVYPIPPTWPNYVCLLITRTPRHVYAIPIAVLLLLLSHHVTESSRAPSCLLPKTKISTSRGCVLIAPRSIFMTCRCPLASSCSPFIFICLARYHRIILSRHVDVILWRKCSSRMLK